MSEPFFGTPALYIVVPSVVVISMAVLCCLIRFIDHKCKYQSTNNSNTAIGGSCVPEILVTNRNARAVSEQPAETLLTAGATPANTCIVDDETLLAATKEIPYAKHEDLEKLVGHEIMKASDIQFAQAQQLFGRTLTVKYSVFIHNVRQVQKLVPTCWNLKLGPSKPKLTDGERWILKHILQANQRNLFNETEFETNPELVSILDTIPLACPFVFFPCPNTLTASRRQRDVDTDSMTSDGASSGLPSSSEAETSSLLVRNWLRNTETPPPKYFNIYNEQSLPPNYEYSTQSETNKA